MPIVRCNNQICHFAHIPKCGGSSIETYMSSLGANLAFLDSGFVVNPPTNRWNISSPQHIDGENLSRLFPPEFFNFSFAVVRNPYSRLFSAFKFQMFVEKKIDEQMDINEFVQNELEQVASGIGFYDNHFRSQSSFFMPNLRYDVFKLENGLSEVKSYLDKKFYGAPVSLDIQHQNRGVKALTPFSLSEESKNIVREIYLSDFENFKYEIDDF